VGGVREIPLDEHFRSRSECESFMFVKGEQGLKMMSKGMDRPFSKEDIWVASKHL
jgi:hypothetical protein